MKSSDRLDKQFDSLQREKMTSRINCVRDMCPETITTSDITTVGMSWTP